MTTLHKCTNTSSPVKYIEIEPPVPYKTLGSIAFGVQDDSPMKSRRFEDLDINKERDIKTLYSRVDTLTDRLGGLQILNGLIRNTLQVETQEIFSEYTLNTAWFSGSDETRSIPEAVKINTLVSAYGILTALKSEEILNEEDYMQTLQIMQNVQREVDFNLAIVPEISSAQRDKIERDATPLIDELIDACKSQSENDLLSEGFQYKNDSFSKRDLTLALLFETLQSDIPTLYYERFRGLKDYLKSAQELKNILRGHPHFQESFTSGQKIPSLVLQRKVLFDIIVKQVNKAFKNVHQIDLNAIQKAKQLFISGKPLKLLKFEFKDTQEVEITTLEAFIGTTNNK